MYLVTIFRRTDSAEFQGDTPWREPAATDPLGSTGRFDRDTARAFSVQSPAGRAQPAPASIRRRGNPLNTPQPIYDGANTRLMVRYELVDLDRLVTSHRDDFAANPAFPADTAAFGRQNSMSEKSPSAAAATEVLARPRATACRSRSLSMV